MAEAAAQEPAARSATDSQTIESGPDPVASPTPKFKPTGGFWAIIATLSMMALLSSLENTVVTTALPAIVTELELGENYIWITNVFFLTAAAVQPLFGQLANIYGRRWVTLAIVAFFTLGSGIAGGAGNGATVIAGRAIQGIGSGGMNSIVDIIVSDLVPLRERGNYMAVILSVYTIGMALGPWVGGVIIATTTWRWVFYINLPVGGTALVMIFLFLHTNYNRSETPLQKVKRIDYAGNAILVASTVSILYALTYGGTTLPWSSGRIIAPLVIGLLGFPLFMWYETTAKEPVVPPNLFSNRTASIIFGATFLNSALLYWVLFFLPVYFQAVLGSSAARAGVQLLPAILFGLPGAIIAVLLLTKFGRYKPLHVFGFGVSVVGLGLFTLLDAQTTTAEYVIYQAVSAIGGGFVLNTLLPSVQAQLPERHQAATTAAWSFVRSFGSIWGVAIPAAIFNNLFAQLSAARIADPAVRAVFAGGNNAYEHAEAAFIRSFPPPVASQIVGVYADSLKLLWQVSIGFTAINFVVVLFEKQVPLRTDLDTEYGLVEKEKEEKTDDEQKKGKKVEGEKEKKGLSGTSMEKVHPNGTAV